jgi:hypothetical protein
MFPDYALELRRARAKRDRALSALENTAEEVAESAMERVSQVRQQGFVGTLIRTSPWATCFASLGAGVAFSRLSAGAAASPPQRVVVEVQGANSTSAPDQKAAAGPFTLSSSLDFIMQALAAYGALRRSMGDGAGQTGGNAEDAQNGFPENPV